MTTAEHATVVGTFADRTQAEYALDELRQVGFGDDQVGFSAGNEAEGERKKQADDDTKKQAALPANYNNRNFLGGIAATSPSYTLIVWYMISMVVISLIALLPKECAGKASAEDAV